MQPQKPKFRLREIVFAVGMGGLAAGGAALALSALHDDDAIHITIGDSESDARQGPDSMSYQAADFDEVSTAGPQHVVISYGEEFSVRSEGSPRALSLLEATVENGRLTIGPKSGFNWFRAGELSGATFYVTMPQLSAITTAGNGRVQVDRIEGDSFAGVVGGPGEISIGQLNVDTADLTVTGSGKFIASGAVGEARITVAGSGRIDADALRSEEATVTIGGSGDVSLIVADEAKVAITGSGDVDITGGASCSVTRMGSGTVRCDGRVIEAN